MAIVRRSWADEYKDKKCPRCKRTLKRLDFSRSEVTPDKKQEYCKKCVIADKVAQKGKRRRQTFDGRVTTIWNGLVNRTRDARCKMTITREEVAELLRKRLCHYCGHKLVKDDQYYRITLDHIVPLARGGATSKDNLVAACWRCNHSKHDRMLVDWKPRWYQVKED